METRSVAQAIARVLRDTACRKIDFYVGSFHVESAGFELVAKALDAGRIKVVIYEALGDGGGYSDERNFMAVASSDVCTTALGRSMVVHEAVHALQDIRNSSQDLGTREATSYIAGALFDAYSVVEFFSGKGSGAVAARGGTRGGVPGTLSRAIGISRVYATKPPSGSSAAIGISAVGGASEDEVIDKAAVAIHKAASEAAVTVVNRPAAKVSDEMVKKLRAAILAHEVYAEIAKKAARGGK